MNSPAMPKITHDILPQSKLDWALFHAANDLPIFPVHSNSKISAVTEFFDRATLNETRIRTWWLDDPDFNIGVATGGDLFVVDADCKKGAPGLASLEWLYLNGDLPESYAVITPSGGKHIYLRSTPGVEIRNSVNRLKGYPGIDIRGHHGYVLGAGSTIDGKAYVIERL